MTLHATREGEDITIHHSPSDSHHTEHHTHVRSFHTELGKLLGPAEGAAQRAYEAYLASCGGFSVHGEALPGWDDQAPEIQAHWEAAAAAV